MKVLLTGATGFVGSHMLERLLHDGHQVHAFVRDPAKHRELSRDGVTLLGGDVITGAGLDSAMGGCDAIIHLVGIIIETHGVTFEKAHQHATANVLAAAKRAGIKKFVHMSAVGAAPGGVSGYQTSKWRAEEAVRASGIPFTILRPSIIFGPRDGFVSQMVQVMKATPLVCPVVGTGKYPFRPIYVDNVVDCFVQSLSPATATGKTIELGGPDEFTLEQILKCIADCVGVRKTAIHIPFGLLYLNASLLQLVLSKPPVTTDQLRMLRQGSTCDIRAMLEEFQLQLVDFRSGLRRYLCKS
jgi:uncharacterized protein YbjT (DUF2867 family)